MSQGTTFRFFAVDKRDGSSLSKDEVRKLAIAEIKNNGFFICF